LFVYKEFRDRVGRLTSHVVLFSNQLLLLRRCISQGSVATHLRCDGIFSGILLQIFS